MAQVNQIKPKKLKLYPFTTLYTAKDKKRNFHLQLFVNKFFFLIYPLCIPIAFSKSQLSIPMNIDDAEKILSDAVMLYAQENPENKNKILEALSLFQELTRTALSLASESNKSIEECLALMARCRIATSQTF